MDQNFRRINPQDHQCICSEEGFCPLFGDYMFGRKYQICSRSCKGNGSCTEDLCQKYIAYFYEKSATNRSKSFVEAGKKKDMDPEAILNELVFRVRTGEIDQDFAIELAEKEGLFEDE